MPSIATLIPFLLNEYQETELSTNDKDCCVIGISQMIYIVAIAISLLFHYGVLLIAIIQLRKYKDFIACSIQYYQIVIRLFRFVIVYTVLRFFPLIERIWEIINDVPFWLILLQHWSIAAVGMGNAMVWFWNRNSSDNAHHRQYDQRIGSLKVDDSSAASALTSTLIQTNTTNIDINVGDLVVPAPQTHI